MYITHLNIVRFLFLLTIITFIYSNTNGCHCLGYYGEQKPVRYSNACNTYVCS